MWCVMVISWLHLASIADAESEQELVLQRSGRGSSAHPEPVHAAGGRTQLDARPAGRRGSAEWAESAAKEERHRHWQSAQAPTDRHDGLVIAHSLVIFSLLHSPLGVCLKRLLGEEKVDECCLLACLGGLRNHPTAFDFHMPVSYIQSPYGHAMAPFHHQHPHHPVQPGMMRTREMLQTTAAQQHHHAQQPHQNGGDYEQPLQQPMTLYTPYTPPTASGINGYAGGGGQAHQAGQAVASPAMTLHSHDHTYVSNLSSSPDSPGNFSSHPNGTYF